MGDSQGRLPGGGGKNKSVPDSKWGMCQAKGKTEERTEEEKALSMDQIKNERLSLAEGKVGFQCRFCCRHLSLEAPCPSQGFSLVKLSLQAC